MPGVWKRLTAVAHTLPYDAELVDALPGRAAAAGRPVGRSHHADTGDVRHREGKPGLLRHGSAAVAAALPDARLVERRGLGHAKKLTPRPSRPPSPSSSTGPGVTVTAQHERRPS